MMCLCAFFDTQLYISTKPSAHLPPLSLVHCLEDIKTWMAANFLKLNNNKTELMVVAPPSLSKEVGDILLNVDGCTIRPSKVVRNLGVTMDCTLSLQAHISNTIKSAYFHLKNICRLRPSLSLSVAETLSHAFITSRLDYCNGVLYGLPSKALDQLQRVQNSAARALTHTKRWQHITPTLKQLHWLPVKSRITYKILLLTYKSLHNLAPQYLSDLLHPYSQSRSLRSSGKDQLVIPRSRLLGIEPSVLLPPLSGTVYLSTSAKPPLWLRSKSTSSPTFLLRPMVFNPSSSPLPFSLAPSIFCKATLGSMKGAI
ncbi:hypothetical protein ACEWY4_013925 [Coilia grayii]|uniref:Reverse transcriptase domain-containing protein n=1 Tax=Coilia grayii TaxID=363190 RepID=A0ABD1JXR8_9TELE